MAEQYKPPREGMPTLSDEPVPFASFQAAVLAPDAEIAAQLRKLLAAYPLGTMDWPLDVMANAASALERRAVLVEALEKARDQFRFYEREHRQKYEAYDARCDGPEPPRDRLAKAETNRQFANMLDAALSRYRATPGQG